MSYGKQSYEFGFPEGVSIVDMAPPHLKDVIHPHWANYPPVNPMWHYLLGVIYIFLGFFSTFGNSTVIYLFLKVKKLRTPANILIFNLALLDLNMLLTNFPFFTYNCFSGGVWMFSPSYCEIYALCGTVTGIGQLWTLVFISYDRYNVIVHGVSGNPLTSTKALLMCLFAWGYAIGCSIPPLVGWGRYIPEGILTSCSIDYFSRDANNLSYAVFLWVTAYCIPLATILYSYVFIVRTVVKHEAAMRAQAKKMNVSNLRQGNEDAESAEMRVAKVAILNVSLWLICWTPYMAIVVQSLFFDQKIVTPLLTSLPALLAKSSATYNPMCYALSHPRFRAAMMTEVPCCCVYEPETTKSDTQSTATEAAPEK